MSKEVVLTREQVREELEGFDLDKKKNICKVLAVGVSGLAIIRVGSTLIPKAVAVAKFVGGSTTFMYLPIPNYLLILIIVGTGVAISNKMKAEKEKAEEERLKNMSILDLMHLEDDDD